MIVNYVHLSVRHPITSHNNIKQLLHRLVAIYTVDELIKNNISVLTHSSFEHDPSDAIKSVEVI